MELSKQAIKDKEMVAIMQNPLSSEREKQKAFDAIYAAHSNAITFFFLKKMRDKNDVEDLKMVTFQKVYSSINLYNPEAAAFSTWLYKIALNSFIDFKRREKFEELSLDEIAEKASDENNGMEFQIKSDAISPEQKMINNQRAKEVQEAIKSIKNEKTRRIVIYRFIMELSFEEIAQLEGMEKNCSTPRIHVKRGLEILHDILSKGEKKLELI